MTDAPTHQRVYQDLRRRILHGELEPGSALTLRGLAAMLSVSMTPAREAVRRLVAERALALSSSGRVTVPDPGPAALAELFRIRALLEPELAERACPRVTRADLAEIRALDDRLTAAIDQGDAAGYVRFNTAFHARIYAEAQAPAMLALVESVWLQTAPAMRRVYGRLGTGSAEVDHHEQALAALEAGDAPGLAQAIRGDVAQGAALAARRGP